jgi:hypothetical protein
MTAGQSTPPPKTPPGAHSLHFSKARAVESRLHDPMRDFLRSAGSSRAVLPVLLIASSRSDRHRLAGFHGSSTQSQKAGLDAQRASQMSQHPDPCFSDDTVRGVLNFLLRTKYYEGAPDYGGVQTVYSVFAWMCDRECACVCLCRCSNQIMLSIIFTSCDGILCPRTMQPAPRVCSSVVDARS